MKSLCTLTLYDLMAEPMDVWLTRNKDFGFKLEIDDENCETLVNDDELHPCAAESFAIFCRSYLFAYEHATRKVAS